MKKADYTYLKESRLADIIRLIAVLGKHSKYSFRSAEGLNGILNGSPKSAATWNDIVEDHPEFFRFNKDKTSIVLLLRFLNTTDDPDDVYEPLSIDQTQKLIDQAITLHDKQLARYQRNNFKIPLYTAILSAIVTIFIAAYTVATSNSNTKEILNRLEKMEQTH